VKLFENKNKDNTELSKCGDVFESVTTRSRDLNQVGNASTKALGLFKKSSRYSLNPLVTMGEKIKSFSAVKGSNNIEDLNCMDVLLYLIFHN
jgi:hypothetical protein